MNDFLRMCFNIITQIGPYLVVLLLLKYLVNLQQKRAKEREEEQKKGIIRTHYTIKTEKFLVVAFIVGTIFFACCTAMSLREKEDMFVICIFGIFFLVGISGIVNMVMWKLEVNGDEITWRSTFGRKRTFHFEDITYCERKKGSMRVYVNGEKLFTIDSNIDKEEFMYLILTEKERYCMNFYMYSEDDENAQNVGIYKIEIALESEVAEDNFIWDNPPNGIFVGGQN